MSFLDYLDPRRLVAALRARLAVRTLLAAPEPGASPSVATPAPAPPRPRRSARPVPVSRGGPERLLQRMARRADSIINSLSGLGGGYDKGTTARPDTSRIPLNFQELTVLYRHNGYAQRFIDIIPAEVTRKGWRIRDDSPDIDPMDAETRRLCIPERAREALTWGRLYGGGYLLIVTDEVAEPGTKSHDLLRQPLDLSRVRAVRNLVVLDPSECQPYVYEGHLTSPRFREPAIWLVSPNSGSGTQAMAGGQQVHHSRILVFPGRRLPSSIRYSNRGIDDSVLESVWDAIRNKTSVDQAAASICQELKLNVMKIEGLANMSTSDQADTFEMRMKVLARTKSLLNMVLMGEGETFESLATPMSGFDQLDANAKEALSAATGMPITLLFGEAPSGLNTDGESHRTLWGNVVAGVQHGVLRDPLTQLYTVLYAAKDGPTKGEAPASWNVEFLPLDELTETEQAALEKTHAETDAIRVSTGILPAEHIAASRYGEKGYQNALLPYDPLAEERAALEEARAALLAAELAQPPAAPPALPGPVDGPPATEPSPPVPGNLRDTPENQAAARAKAEQAVREVAPASGVNRAALTPEQLAARIAERGAPAPGTPPSP